MLEVEKNIVSDYKNATYTIEGEKITLKNGYAETETSPQTINNSQNPNHKNVIVINYADRAENEPSKNLII